MTFMGIHGLEYLRHLMHLHGVPQMSFVKLCLGNGGVSFTQHNSAVDSWQSKLNGQSSTVRAWQLVAACKRTLSSLSDVTID